MFTNVGSKIVCSSVNQPLYNGENILCVDVTSVLPAMYRYLAGNTLDALFPNCTSTRRSTTVIVIIYVICVKRQNKFIRTVRILRETAFRVFSAARYPVDSRCICVYNEMGTRLCRPFSVCINTPTTW